MYKKKESEHIPLFLPSKSWYLASIRPLVISQNSSSCSILSSDWVFTLKDLVDSSPLITCRNRPYNSQYTLTRVNWAIFGAKILRALFFTYARKSVMKIVMNGTSILYVAIRFLNAWAVRNTPSSAVLLLLTRCLCWNDFRCPAHWVCKKKDFFQLVLEVDFNKNSYLCEI